MPDNDESPKPVIKLCDLSPVPHRRHHPHTERGVRWHGHAGGIHDACMEAEGFFIPLDNRVDEMVWVRDELYGQNAMPEDKDHIEQFLHDNSMHGTFDARPGTPGGDGWLPVTVRPTTLDLGVLNPFKGMPAILVYATANRSGA